MKNIIKKIIEMFGVTISAKPKTPAISSSAVDSYCSCRHGWELRYREPLYKKSVGQELHESLMRVLEGTPERGFKKIGEYNLSEDRRVTAKLLAETSDPVLRKLLEGELVEHLATMVFADDSVCKHYAESAPSGHCKACSFFGACY